MTNRTRVRVSLGLIASATILVVVAAWAHTTGVFATPTAVAVVDIFRLQESLIELQALEKQFLDKNAAFKAEIVEMKLNVQTLRARHTEEGPTMTPEARNDLTAEILRLEARVNADSEILDTLLQIDAYSVMKVVYEKIYDAVDRVAVRDGWDIVLFDTRSVDVMVQRNFQDMNAAVGRRSILYVNERADITSDVVTLMNNEFEAAAAAPEPKPADKDGP